MPKQTRFVIRNGIKDVLFLVNGLLAARYKNLSIEVQHSEITEDNPYSSTDYIVTIES